MLPCPKFCEFDEISDKDIEEFMENIDEYKADISKMTISKVYRIYDGSNYSTIILESDYDDGYILDDEGMFDNLIEIDRAEAGTGYTHSLVKNDKYLFIEVVSQWQSDITTRYYPVSDMAITKLEEIYKKIR